jgi:hypothetical protein
MEIADIERQLISERDRQAKPAELLQTALRLYVDSRIDSTDVEKDGDMLLFQWGTYDWGEGTLFEVGLTRQITKASCDPDEEADSMQQLQMTFRFSSTEETTALGKGNEWCPRPSNVNLFLASIKSNGAYIFALERRPIETEIALDHV